MGQGLAVLVRTREHSLLYDTGPRLGPDFDTGRAVVMPYLVNQSIKRLDKVIISHGDNDHAGGLGSLLSLIEVSRVLSSSPTVLNDSILEKEGVQGSYCGQGQHWEWDGVLFDVLYPARSSDYEGNNSSCVLRVEARGQALLLPGDIERAGELALLEHYGDALRADVLLAPHHGSNSSSSDELIAAVAPIAVVYSAGYRSQFRHPAEPVALRYRALEVKAHNTALQGALSFTLGLPGQALTLSSYREADKRFWRMPYGEANRRLHGL